MIKLVIFDFDGTIVNSKIVYYETIAKYLSPFGFSKKSIHATIDIGMNLEETLKRFIPSNLYRWWIKKRIMHEVSKEIKYVKKCHDVSHIRDIKAKKILVSNSYSEFVLPVLKNLKAKKYFKEIYCADRFSDKEKFIEKYLKFHNLKPKECFYVGDRVADVKLAKEAGLHNIIISGKCAWDSKKELLEAKPEFIVPDLIFVKRIIERF